LFASGFAAINSGFDSMRFLMLNWRDPRNPQSGGAERVTLAFLRELKSRGHDVWWFANDFEGAAKEEVIDGLHLVRGGRRGTSILAARRWYRLQPRFDLVMDQHHGIPWFAPWWCRTNSVAYIHEVLGPIWKAFYRWPINAIGQTQERWTHWFYRRVPFWTPSESTKNALLKNGVREVKVLPNGTDATPLPALDPKDLSKPLRLVAVSRLAPNKRVDHALRAARALLDRNVPTTLTVVGGGEMADQLKRLAGELQIKEHITFTGSISEEAKNQELRQAHFLVHTSIREGWGLNVIEANAMGTPAIVYPVGGLVDSTVHNETGMVTETETPESIADEVIRFMGAPARYGRLRVQAWERSKTFQWQNVLPLTCDWLELQARGNK
jgi:glycosyltransferase involved in cell wall biosynthesis